MVYNVEKLSIILLAFMNKLHNEQLLLLVSHFHNITSDSLSNTMQ